MDLHMRVTEGVLKPSDRVSATHLAQYQEGEILRVHISKPRNVKFHRLFFALLQTVFNNLPEDLEQKIPTVDRLLWELKLQMGRFDISESIGGKQIFIPHSISFASMDGDEFERFFADAIHVIRKKIIPGIQESALRDAVDSEMAKYGA